MSCIVLESLLPLIVEILLCVSLCQVRDPVMNLETQVLSPLPSTTELQSELHVHEMLLNAPRSQSYAYLRVSPRELNLMYFCKPAFHCSV